MCVCVRACVGPKISSWSYEDEENPRHFVGGPHLLKGHLRVRISGLRLVNVNPACDYRASLLAPIVSLVGQRVNTFGRNYW